MIIIRSIIIMQGILEFTFNIFHLISMMMIPFHFQRVALETIINSASKKEKCTGVLQSGVDIMKQLYESKNDHIRVRALVGLCKIGSAGGSDSGVKMFAEGSNVALSVEARK